MFGSICCKRQRDALLTILGRVAQYSSLTLVSYGIAQDGTNVPIPVIAIFVLGTSEYELFLPWVLYPLRVEVGPDIRMLTEMFLNRICISIHPNTGTGYDLYLARWTLYHRMNPDICGVG